MEEALDERGCGVESVCGAAASEENDCDLAAAVREAFALPEREARLYAPLVLAYLGDAVFELVVRTLLTGRSQAAVDKLHKRASGIVKAGAQRALYRAVETELTEEEQAIFRRGRNAKSGTVAKNATLSDYRAATGFEALIGYLYLVGRFDRILYLVRAGLEKTGGEYAG